MNIIVCKNYEEMSRVGAKMIGDLVERKPNCVLGLATGATPEGVYDLLAERCKNGLDFSKVKTANLDEYVGLTPDDDQSYRYFMNTHLFDRINIDKANTNIPNASKADERGFCEYYDKMIDDMGGIDLQLLGIGENGHVGFNEPAESLVPLTHITGLTESTLNANKRYFPNREMPTKAVTMGMKTILKAKSIIIMAHGIKKRDAISTLVKGLVTTSCPASLLNLHDNVTLICDEEAFGNK